MRVEKISDVGLRMSNGGKGKVREKVRVAVSESKENKGTSVTGKRCNTEKG